MSDIIKNNKGTIINKSNDIHITNKGIESGSNNPLLSVGWYKDLLADDKVEQCLRELKAQFRSQSNNNALNTVIMYSLKISEIAEKYSLELISREQFSVEKAKVVDGILHLIDNEVKLH